MECTALFTGMRAQIHPPILLPVTVWMATAPKCFFETLPIPCPYRATPHPQVMATETL